MYRDADQIQFVLQDKNGEGFLISWLHQIFPEEAMSLKESLNFPLLSDFNKKVSSEYGVLYDNFIGFEGVSKRSAFVISKDGKISYSWSSDDPKQLPDFSLIKQALT